MIVLFRFAVAINSLFMDDNMRPNRVVEVLNTLKRENIEHMEWTPKINDIEHAWDVLGRCVS